jgi:lipoate-protein ligase A
MQKWRLIESGAGSPGRNMAIDEALLRGFSEGDLPIFRLYRWQPSLSLGRFQNAGESIDLERRREVGIPCVRRMTGGGALLHGGDLSYALVLPRHTFGKKGVRENYRRLCTFLILLYEKLGLEARFVRDLKLPERASSCCLAGREAYDIVIGGAKMGGNAQRYTQQALFQHGSIPLEIDTATFAPLFREASGLSEAASLQKLGVEARYDAVAAAAFQAFRESFGAELVPDTLSGSEARSAAALLERKYSTEEWNCEGRSQMA